MAVTQNISVGDGTTRLFPFTFEYIKQADVNVSIDGVLQPTTAYSFATATSIEFTTAPSSGASVRIYRVTDIDDIRATFFAGSAIRAQDLNNNDEQLLFALQERADQFVTEENAEFLNDVDLNNNKLTEVKDPTNAQDAATKNYVDTQTWSDTDETIYSNEAWQSVDTQIATTQAIDGRIDNKIDLALTNDVAGSDGITITDDQPGNGQITIGIGAGSIDLDRIKSDDIISYSEQNAGSPSPADDNIFTASAAARRFDTLVQTSTPTGTQWELGKTWLQDDSEKTVSIWDGSAWIGVASGGTFVNQPKVVYVDSSSGSDTNDGHRISRPKLTIKAAIQQINSDSTYGDGSVVVVAPGVYQEVAPIQIQKKDVSIIGDALRSCIIHPTEATKYNALFEVNSGSYLKNLTFTGVQAGTGTGNSVDAALPTDQGWNVAFFGGATITKSPYIQNCTNFSDSEIDNNNLNAHNPAGGAAGDIDSAPTGGGLLIDGSVVSASSPLRSIVCDSYTHVGLNGPGILVTNNGYAQCTSSYAFFNKYHIKCLNGGQANLAASTTDFGDEALVADGKSSSAIFTSNVDGAAASEAISFSINQPTAQAGWHGTATRPQGNMLVAVNGNTYPILSAVANTDSEGNPGWTVTISRPDPNNRSNNLGLDGAVADNASVDFYLRSMIASSGHTMEYVGSGTDYRALPENGGVPNDSKQKIERNGGKIWTATTDHNGKFTIGGNQTDDPIFEVDQQLGFVTIPEGSIAFNLLSDLTPQLGGNLDVNSNTITGLPATPTSATEATSKAYVDAQIAGIDEVVEDTSPQLGGNLDVNGNTITSASNGNVVIDPNGTGTINVGATITSVDANQNIVLDPNGTGQVEIESPLQVDVSLTIPDAGGDLHVGNNFIVTNAGNVTAAAANFDDVTLNNQSDLRFAEDSSVGNNYVGFQAPASITANVIWTLPATDATVNGHALKSDGSGNLSWGTAGGASGGGTDQVFYENDQSVTTSYSISANKNAISAGPITIDSGATVTVPSGSTWTIV